LSHLFSPVSATTAKFLEFFFFEKRNIYDNQDKWVFSKK